jgi:alpha-glucosidase (family GH31 glycosyl hydrolase)
LIVVTFLQGVYNKGPSFELFPDGKPPTPSTSLKTTSESLTFTSGSLSAEINTTASSYSLSFNSAASSEKSAPLFLCSTEPKGTAVVDVPISHVSSQMSESSVLETGSDALRGTFSQRTEGKGSDVRFMLNELSLSVGETIYGLGERFGPLVKNGGCHSIWNMGAFPNGATFFFPFD